MANNKEKNTFLFNILLLTVFFNIWFPKAGIKLAGIPLTIGNVLLAITFIGWILKIMINGSVKIHKVSYLIVFVMVYAFIRFFIAGDMLSSIGYVIPLVVYPLIFFITYDLVDTKAKEKKIIKVICYGFFFICIYSLLQYVFGIEKVCIPGLTVNFSDYSTYGVQWYLQKNNLNNGIGTKIVSTFQNGNLFGVNALLIYPIVYCFYKNNNKKILMYISLVLFIICVFLSLSRSCWLGIILFILFGILFETVKTKNNLARKIVMTGLCIAVVLIAFKYFPSIVERFSVTNASSLLSMSGRTEGLLSVIEQFSKYRYLYIWLIGSQGFIDNIGIAYEMTPIALLVQTGLIGAISFYLILYKVCNLLDKKNWIQYSVKLSVLIWAMVSCIEGGFWLPPTALNLFLILAIGLLNKKNIELEKGEN